MTDSDQPVEPDEPDWEPTYAAGDGLPRESHLWEAIDSIFKNYELKPEAGAEKWSKGPEVYGRVTDREIEPECRPEGCVKYGFVIGLYGEIDLEKFLDEQHLLMGICEGVEVSLRGFEWDNAWKFDIFVQERGESEATAVTAEA